MARKSNDVRIASESDIPTGTILPKDFKWDSKKEQQEWYLASDAETSEFAGCTLVDENGNTVTVKYNVLYAAYPNYAAVKAADAIPKGEEITKMVNAKEKAAARSSFMNAKLDSLGYVKPTVVESEADKLRGFIQTLADTRKMEFDSALAMAAPVLNKSVEEIQSIFAAEDTGKKPTLKPTPKPTEQTEAA